MECSQCLHENLAIVMNQFWKIKNPSQNRHQTQLMMDSAPTHSLYHSLNRQAEIKL